MAGFSSTYIANHLNHLQEHTYAMCPGCPTFSIPIPIPKQAIEAPVRAPERNGQLEYRPEYYDTREKVGIYFEVYLLSTIVKITESQCDG